MGRLRRTFWAAATFVTLTAAVASCGGGSDDADDARPGGTTSTTANEEAAVLDAYEAGWQAFDEASGDPVNPGHPALTETMTGTALDAARRSLTQMSGQGEYLDGGVDLSPEVTELSADRAVVEDCVLDHGQKHAADGTVIARSDPEPALYQAVMVNEGGVWKRSELTQGEQCTP